MDSEQMLEQSTQIVEFKPFEAKMREFRKRYDGVVYDLDDPRQEKQARSDRYQIGKEISALDKAHAEIKKPLAEKVRLIDGARKFIKDELLAIQDKIKSQIAAREAKIKAEAEALQAKIDAVMALVQFDAEPDSGLIRSRLETAQAIDPEADKYGTRKADAALAVRQIIKTLAGMLDKCVAFEEEQAELARLRAEKEERERKERDERIRKEAAERAKREAEERAKAQIEEARRREERAKAAKAQAEAAAKAAEERRERERKASEERHAREVKEAEERAAAQAKLAEQRKQEEAQRKVAAEQREIARKAADKKHRQRIRDEALEDLQQSFDSDIAHKVLQRIYDGHIRHVTINY